MNDEAKIKFLSFIPCFTASLSIICSSLILSLIYKTGKAGIKLTTYHRLLLGVAFFDIVFSLGLALGPFLMPSETGLPYAYGNQQSCSFQSFLLTFGMTGFGYSTCLMMYYLLVIRYNLKDQFIARWYEPIFHFIPLTFHTSVAISGFFLQVYNSQGLRCWVGASPLGCEENPDLECKRGGEYEVVFGSYLVVLPQCIYVLLILLFLTALGATVWQQYQRQKRFSFMASDTGMSKERMQLVITQCFLYGFSFLALFVWGVVATFMIFVLNIQYDALGKHFWLTAFISTLVPMQGVFYFCIFIRPRYLSLRRSSPTLNRWQAFLRAINQPAQQSAGSSYSGNILSRRANSKLSHFSETGSSNHLPASSQQTNNVTQSTEKHTTSIHPHQNDDKIANEEHLEPINE